MHADRVARRARGAFKNHLKLARTGWFQGRNYVVTDILADQHSGVLGIRGPIVTASEQCRRVKSHLIYV